MVNNKHDLWPLEACCLNNLLKAYAFKECDLFCVGSRCTLGLLRRCVDIWPTEHGCGSSTVSICGHAAVSWRPVVPPSVTSWICEVTYWPSRPHACCRQWHKLRLTMTFFAKTARRLVNVNMAALAQQHMSSILLVCCGGAGAQKFIVSECDDWPWISDCLKAIRMQTRFATLASLNLHSYVCKSNLNSEYREWEIIFTFQHTELDLVLTLGLTNNYFGKGLRTSITYLCYPFCILLMLIPYVFAYFIDQPLMMVWSKRGNIKHSCSSYYSTVQYSCCTMF